MNDPHDADIEWWAHQDGTTMYYYHRGGGQWRLFEEFKGEHTPERVTLWVVLRLSGGRA